MSERDKSPVMFGDLGIEAKSGVHEPIKKMTSLERVELHAKGRAYFTDIHPVMCVPEWPFHLMKATIEMQGGECIEYEGQFYAVMGMRLQKALQDAKQQG